MNNYQKLTSKHIQDVLPNVLKEIREQFSQDSNLVLESWPLIIGENLSTMTRAVSFIEGILTVNVTNSSLLSLLCSKDKKHVLRKLRESFPKTEIKNIHFRLGSK